MKRVTAVVSVLALAFLFSGVVAGQDKKPADKSPPEKKKTRKALPRGWKALDLKPDQKEKVYAIQEKYRGKIRDLTEQLKQLRKQQQTELETVLTDAQKKRLHDTMASKKKGKKSSSTKEKKKKSRKKKKDSKGSKAEDKKATGDSEKPKDKPKDKK